MACSYRRTAAMSLIGKQHLNTLDNKKSLKQLPFVRCGVRQWMGETEEIQGVPFALQGSSHYPCIKGKGYNSPRRYIVWEFTWETNQHSMSRLKYLVNREKENKLKLKLTDSWPNMNNSISWWINSSLLWCLSTTDFSNFKANEVGFFFALLLPFAFFHLQL